LPGAAINRKSGALFFNVEVAMGLKSLQLGRALNLVMRTLPIALVRLGALLLFWLASLLYLAIIGGLAWLVGQAIPIAGGILFLVGLGGMGGLYHLARRYVLYIIKAAQIAVIAELLTQGELPAGVSQLAWGKERVQERFGEASIMFAMDQLVMGVVSVFTGTVYQVASFLPGNALRSLARMINRVVRFSLHYVDEAILARTFWMNSENVWTNARDGVVLYGMVWKPLLVNATALMLLSYIPFVLALILFSAPIAFLASLISPTVAGWSIIATLVLAWLIKVAVGDTFAMSAMIATYHQETVGLEPDPAIVARLEQVSKRFRDLQARAKEELGVEPEPPVGPAPVFPA
jgi:hypothetical protein